MSCGSDQYFAACSMFTFVILVGESYFPLEQPSMRILYQLPKLEPCCGVAWSPETHQEDEKEKSTETTGPFLYENEKTGHHLYEDGSARLSEACASG